MTNMNKKALVIGATGLVGKALVKQLQAASEFESVTVVVRKELDEFKVFSKVSQFVLEDFLLLNDQDVSGYTHAFSCLGSTNRPLKKQALNKNFMRLIMKSMHILQIYCKIKKHICFW